MKRGQQQPIILVTGAAGYLGGLLRTGLDSTRYGVRLTDLAVPADLKPNEHFVAADLADINALMPVFENVESVVHLGGRSVEEAWPKILSANIEGTFNLFEAARQAGVKRIVYASSHHVVGFYPRSERIGPDAPPRPDSRYGVSKVFGEALGRLYADKHGMEVICLRLGVVRPKPPNRRALSAWLSEADFLRLCHAALAVPSAHFEVTYGVSANRSSFWSHSGGAKIGFVPQDDAESHLTPAEIAALPDDPSEVERAFQGGWFCGMEFDGNIHRIFDPE